MARHAPPGVERVEAELARCWLRLRRWFSRARRADDGRGLQALRLSVRPPGDSLEAEHVVGVGEGDQLAQEDLEEVGGRGHRQRRTGTGCHVGGVADVGGGDRDRPNRDERGDAGGVAKSGVPALTGRASQPGLTAFPLLNDTVPPPSLARPTRITRPREPQPQRSGKPRPSWSLPQARSGSACWAPAPPRPAR